MGGKPGKDADKEVMLVAIGKRYFIGIMPKELCDYDIEEGNNEEHVHRLVAGLTVAADVVPDEIPGPEE